MTSLEAAALYLSDGATKDPNEAVHYNATGAGSDGFDLDELQKAHLRRMMGCDFSITIKNKRLTVFTTEYPYVSKTVKTSGLMNEKTVDKLVDTCLAVKLMFEEEKQKVADNESDTNE
jgi:hypothetical protein